MPCNRARAAEIMRERRLDALVTSSQANLTYVLNYPTLSSCMSEATIFAVLPADPTAGPMVVASRNSASMVAEWALNVQDVWLWGVYHVEFPEDVPMDRLPELPRRHAAMLREWHPFRSQRELPELFRRYRPNGLRGNPFGKAEAIP